MKVTKNGLGYVKITNDDLKKYGVDSASVGSIMNNYNFIHGLICWVVFSEDVKNNVIRTSARSRGVKINKLFEQYNGGGHVYACGAKLQSFSEADEIIDKLDDLCKEYKEGN
jgi:phosphoesterase RecJ-like protein